MEEKITKPITIVGNPVRLFLGIAIAAVVLGTLTGFILSTKSSGSKISSSLSSNTKAKTAQQDTQTFKDFAEGTIKTRPQPSDNEYSEGTHLLVREGAVPVALTSSVVDLSQYEGKKVKVFGETFAYVSRLNNMPKIGSIGSIGENTAARWLKERGFSINDTNYRKKYGELDIVAEKNGVLHFVEVKTSKFYGDSAFSPEIRVNTRKIRKLKQLCETYLRETHVSQDQLWQIDVISVILNDDMSVRSVNSFENAVFERQY